MENKDIYEQIRKMVIEVTKFMRPYTGLVQATKDPQAVADDGSVLVTIAELGWIEPSVGIWAQPLMRNDLKVPAEGDSVIVIFLNGDENRAYYIGIDSALSLLPVAQKGLNSNAVIYSDRLGLCPIVHDLLTNTLSAGTLSPTKGYAGAARVGDTIQIDATTAPALFAWLTAVGTATGVGPPPTTITGKITTGSSQVTIGDKI